MIWIAFDHSLKRTEIHTHNEVVHYSWNYTMPICKLKKMCSTVAGTIKNSVKTTLSNINYSSIIELPWQNPGQQHVKKKIQINSWNILLRFFYHIFYFRCTFIFRCFKSSSPFTPQDEPCDPTYSYLFPSLVQTIALFLFCFKFFPNDLTFLPLPLNIPLFSCLKKNNHGITLLFLVLHPLFHQEYVEHIASFLSWTCCSGCFANLLFTDFASLPRVTLFS